MPNKYDDDYTRVYWENLPSHNTPINQQNLNKMDAQIKTLTTRVSDMSAYIPNVMYVDELPEQGVEGLLYVESIIEHGFELTGLPERYQSQSALDTWINQGNFAFMLHLSSVVTDDTYAIIENVLVKTVTSIPDEYTVSEMNGDVTTYYLYDPDTKTWDSSTYGTLSVNDIIVGIGQVNINSKLPTHYYATGGDISDNLGIENIIGDMTITSNTSHYSPPIIYSDNNNTYEIYQAKPIQVLSPKNVYMWSDDTRSFFGFQKEYEAGQNITFTQQGTKVIISATGGGGGGGSVDITQFTITSGDGTTVQCNMTINEIISRLNNNTLIAQAYIHEGSSITSYKVPLTRVIFGGGTTYDFYFEYFDLTTTSLISWKVQKTGNPSEDTYTATKTVTQYQGKLTEGDGIDITNGVISVNYPNGDTIEY